MSTCSVICRGLGNLSPPAVGPEGKTAAVGYVEREIKDEKIKEEGVVSI